MASARRQRPTRSDPQTCQVNRAVRSSFDEDRIEFTAGASRGFGVAAFEPVPSRSTLFLSPSFPLSVPNRLASFRRHLPLLRSLKGARLVAPSAKNESHRKILTVRSVTQMRERQGENIQFVEQFLKPYFGSSLCKSKDM